MATIGDHTITNAERRAVGHLQDWLRANGGDSCTEPNCSPAGDGRWVPLSEVFPRYPDGQFQGGSRSNAQRQAIRRLHKKGVLVAYEIAFYAGCVKAMAAERVAELERGLAAMTPAEREIAFFAKTARAFGSA